jgi:hypothetical protein
MRRVFKRIALHGSLTALVLGLTGLLFAELTGLWLTGSGGVRNPTGDGAVQDVLRQRIPLLMALWGFLFIAGAEIVLYLWRGEPKVKATKAAPPDEAELLLEELLKQAEAKAAQEQAAGNRVEGVEGGGAKGSDAPNDPGASILTPKILPRPPSP